jgi:peptidoglycan biosynthesis protein MviN/MurJ (putative lipid II flippase)
MNIREVPRLLASPIHRIRKRILVWDSLTTTTLQIIGRAIGLASPFFIAVWFGATGETDTFFFAYGIVLFLSNIFSPAIEHVIVPYIAELRSADLNVDDFVGRLVGVTAAALLPVVLAAFWISKPFLSVITNFDADQIMLARRTFAEMSPIVILLVWTSIVAGTLNAHKRFAWPALSPGIRAFGALGGVDRSLEPSGPLSFSHTFWYRFQSPGIHKDGRLPGSRYHRYAN